MASKSPYKEMTKEQASVAVCIIDGQSRPNSTPLNWIEVSDGKFCWEGNLCHYRTRFFMCPIEGRVFDSKEPGHGILQDGSKVSSVAIAKSGLIKCPSSGYYFAAAEAVEVFHNGDWRKLSPKAARDTLACHFSGKRYASEYVTEVLIEAPDGECGASCVTVGSHWREANKSKIRQCSACERHGIDGMLKPVRKALMKTLSQSGNLFPQFHDGAHICPFCETERLRSLIGKHNCKIYPKPIQATEATRIGHKVVDGFVFSTGKREAVADAMLFGVEVETEFSKNKLLARKLDRYDMTAEIIDALGPDFVRAKEDGTLTANGKYSDGDPNAGMMFAGVEFVSAPSDLATHRVRWPKLAESTNYDALRAWDYDTCGFHVHVSRAALTPLQIDLMVYFINHPDNKKFIEVVAGRTEQRYTRFYPKDLAAVLKPDGVVSKDEEDAHNRSRRVALNISNQATVEFRIFRGTVNPRHILRNIEFCQAVANFCLPCTRSFKEYGDWSRFCKFVSENRKERNGGWPLLAAWMAMPEREWIKIKPLGINAKKELLTLKMNDVPESCIPTKPQKEEPKIPAMATAALQSNAVNPAPASPSKPKKSTLEQLLDTWDYPEPSGFKMKLPKFAHSDNSMYQFVSSDTNQFMPPAMPPPNSVVQMIEQEPEEDIETHQF